MAGSDSNSRWRGLRRLLTVALVVAIAIALIGVAPARALQSGSASAAGTTGSTTASSATGMAAYINSKGVPPAPATFQSQLTSFINSFSAAAKQYPDLTKNLNMPVASNSALQLVSSANSADLAVLYYMFQRMPQWHQASKYTKKVGREYTQALNWAHAQQPRLRLRANNYDDACPAQITTALERGILNTLNDLAETIYNLFPDSFTVQVLGVAYTFEASPIKLIASIVKIITWALAFAAESANKIRVDCTVAAHQNQMDALVTYNQDHIANEQLNVNVTPLDQNHYLVAAHENGLPLSVNLSGIQLETTIGTASSTGQNTRPLINSGGALNSDGTTTAATLCNTPAAPPAANAGVITQVSFCPVLGTDAGLYELIIPNTLIGSSYRIILDDGFTCPTSPDPGWEPISNCDHYGVQVFTKATNS